MKSQLELNTQTLISIDQYRQSLMSHQQHIRKQADDLLENRYYFVETWDMERCAEPYTIDPFDWEVCPNGDDEWTFMLNRMSVIPILVNASVICGEKKYAEHARTLIMAWIQSHDVMLPGTSTRTLDTAMRISHWVEALPYLIYLEVISSADIAHIEQSIRKQFAYLRENYLPKYTLSNWGSIQTSVFIQVLPLLDADYQNNADFKWAKRELEQQLRIQVYDDGFHWEQSTMYHVEVMNYVMKAQRILEDSEIDTILRRMADALMYQRTPDNKLVMFGDTDRSDLTTIMTQCAYVLKDGRYLNFGDSMDISSLIYLNIPLVPLESESITLRSFDGHDSGMYTTRSDWSNNANFTLFTNGSLGSGHGHCDNLHYATYYKGDPVLVDSGRFTYREDRMERTFLKSMAAHNSVILDDNPIAQPLDSWTNAKFIKPLKNYVRHHEDTHYYEGGTYGEGVTHIRKILVHDSGIWQITDEVHCLGNHKASIRYQLDPTVKIQDNCLTTQRGHKLNIMTEGTLESYETLMSAHYNECVQHTVLMQEINFTDTLTTTTLFYPESMTVIKKEIIQGAGNRVDDSVATAYQFDDTITTVVLHQEIWRGNKILFVDEQPFHAKALVITDKTMKVLRT
ncbi:oligohyaluronate lyase [Erysipelothrix sp. HDW6C]|uniref:alginate lyase family protein n=1 Tax=Erysipelothrix sp. HDW6C TaxID=2714930 RepID=UPI0014074C12|nr:alginate lyase family protein [Erysipelothrix sp. HDW6C]QIK69285.1 oligohyaluronate lyase [Erysipelothrix sp. HDW6C]